jgi:hypothetical protein
MTDQNQDKPEPIRANRRLFLRGAGVAAVAVPMAAKAEALVQPTNHQIGARYQESDHIKQFYALNRR